MKIAVFSDIHGNLPALKAILKDIQNYRADKIICLGDTIAMGPQSGECLDIIMQNNIKTVLGNHELYFLRGTEIDGNMSAEEKAHHKHVKKFLSAYHLKYISELPLYIELQCGRHKLLFAHFFIDDKKSHYPFYGLNVLQNKSTVSSIVRTIDDDMIFIGHEHTPFELNFPDKKVYGIGSSGCSVNNFTNYYLIDFDEQKLSVQRKTVEYEREALIKNFDTSDYPCKDFIKRTFFGIV